MDIDSGVDRVPTVSTMDGVGTYSYYLRPNPKYRKTNAGGAGRGARIPSRVFREHAHCKKCKR